MGIVESIQSARKRGMKDQQILQETIRQNPSKKEGLEKALQRGATPTQILEEIIKQNKTTQVKEKNPEDRIEEARKRLKALKETAPVPSIEETPEREPISLSFKRPKPAPVTPKQETPPFVRSLPKKLSLREKLWVRVLAFCLILVVLAGVVSFWYWYFEVRPEPHIGCTQDQDCPEGFICGPGGVCKESSIVLQCSIDQDCSEGFYCSNGTCLKTPEGPAPAPSMFAIEEQRILEVANSDEVRNLLSQTLQEYQDTGEVKRIIFKNTTENKFLGIKEFFDALQIRVSDNFYSAFENDFNLFVYSQSQGNRLGFATEVKDKNSLESILLTQESSLKEDFKPFFALVVEDKPPVVSYFRNANQLPGYVGYNFRYQTLDTRDVGICYLVSTNYFAMTSSFKSMEEIIERLGVPGPTVELTKDLFLGDRGYEVEILQTWLKQDASIYSRGLVTGYYGLLTQEAVTKFQEKYASEVLAPQGKVKGTGQADEYTRVKLNELYGETGSIPPRPEITTDLRYGNHGDEVRLLQKWLSQDKNVYPEGIISGWFGPLTQNAVARFQEKYASEILDPQGLTKGSGIVDGLTRRKLNELFGR